MCSVLKCSNDWLLNCKFLDGVRRIGGQSQLSNLGRVPVLWVWVIRSSGFLWAQLVIALDDNSTELKRCLLVWSLHIDQQSWSTWIIDAWFVIRGRLSLLGAASTRIMKHLETSLTGSRLLAVAKALLRCGLAMVTTQALVLWLLLRLLIWKAFVVSLL